MKQAIKGLWGAYRTRRRIVRDVIPLARVRSLAELSLSTRFETRAVCSLSLDLGSGPAPKNPFGADQVFGIDIRSNESENIKAADLSRETIPFENEKFDYVTAFDFIEHVPRVIYCPERRFAFIELMNEVWRILKPGGIFLSHTPIYPFAEAFQDPTHVNIISANTFSHYFDDVNRGAAIYGFNGAFKVRLEVLKGSHLVSVLEKVKPR